LIATGEGGSKMSFMCNGCKQIKDEHPSATELFDVSEKYGDGATREVCYCSRCVLVAGKLTCP